MTLKTFVYTFALLLSSSILQPLHAQVKQKATPTDTLRTTSAPAATKSERFQGVQYASPEEAAAALAAQNDIPLFAGVAVSADLAGAAMAAFTPYGQYEAAARANFRGRYFPIVEVGMGVSNHTNETTNNHYKVHAPYYRIGLDYNVMKNRRSGNRIFVGLRYAFTTYKYDVDAPDIHDPVYDTVYPFHFSGLKGTNHWAEAVFGLEARVWGILHLGWSVRYKLRIYNKKSIVGYPWYVPGFGKNDSHALGGTFNVIFDI